MSQILWSSQVSSLGDQWKDLWLQLINVGCFLWIPGQVLSWIWSCLLVWGSWRFVCVCVQSGRCAQLTAWSAFYFKERKHRSQLCPSLPTLRTWHFPLATLETLPISPHLSTFPLPSHNTLFGFSDSHLAWLASEPWNYWLFLLLLRSLQVLQTSTKLWAFSQFTHRFIICWHCFSINRATFTDIIDSTASLLTNSLFNVSNPPWCFT